MPQDPRKVVALLAAHQGKCQDAGLPLTVNANSDIEREAESVAGVRVVIEYYVVVPKGG